MNKGIYILLLGFILAGFPHYAFSPSTDPELIASFQAESESLFQKIDANGLSYAAFDLAYRGFNILVASESGINDSVLTIIDFSQSSVQKRLYVIDVKNGFMLENSLVAHGMNSGILFAENFSNESKSHMSSLGFYLTADTYEGKHGYSLRLRGIEKDINDNAHSRAIVMHGAHYADERFIAKYNRLGRSFGCPALPYDKNKTVINLIRNNSCLFIYYPDEQYLLNSNFAKYDSGLRIAHQ